MEAVADVAGEPLTEAAEEALAGAVEGPLVAVAVARRAGELRPEEAAPPAVEDSAAGFRLVALAVAEQADSAAGHRAPAERLAHCAAAQPAAVVQPPGREPSAVERRGPPPAKLQALFAAARVAVVLRPARVRFAEEQQLLALEVRRAPFVVAPHLRIRT